MTDIVIVDPHPVWRLGLKRLLSNSLLDSAIQTFDYQELESKQGYDSPCDLVLLSCPKAINKTSKYINTTYKLYTPKHILLLSDKGYDAKILTSDQPLIRGLVTKDASPELLLNSVMLVLSGGTCFPPFQTLIAHNALANESMCQLSDSSINPLSILTEELMKAEAKLLGLTPRQYQVLVLLARGYPIKTVSKHLKISVATAKAHTETIYERLNVHNRNEAVYEAVAHGASLGWSKIAGYKKND